MNEACLPSSLRCPALTQYLHLAGTQCIDLLSIYELTESEDQGKTRITGWLCDTFCFFHLIS